MASLVNYKMFEKPLALSIWTYAGKFFYAMGGGK
jgi:hypothetical protein